MGGTNNAYTVHVYKKKQELAKLLFNIQVQLRGNYYDLDFNFNFDDEMENLWIIWISRKVNKYVTVFSKEF